MALVGQKLELVDRAIARFMGEHAILFLRLALSVVYIWFGALKLLEASPVEELVLKTVYYVPRYLVLPLLGIWEIAIGLGLLSRKFLRTTIFLLIIQLAGTLTLFFLHPHETFQNGNPFLLTQTGEFVIKNLVLIAAALAIGSTARRRSETIPSEPTAQSRR